MEKLQKEHPSDALADALEVSESGFEAHRLKPERPRARHDAQLKPLIEQSFHQSRRTYGSPRVLRDLRDRGHRCGKNRIARLMRQQGLRARQKRRFRPCTTDSRYTLKPAENWLAKVPMPDQPGQIWQSDLTYIETGEGWLYLAFTLDSFSRRCVAHHCQEDMSVALTIATLERAIFAQPPPRGLIHHSDRGSQYAASGFQQRLHRSRITQSMSRKGNPYDNALAESFVATLKTECFNDFIPATKTAAKLMIFDYIETFYNTRRRHSSLGYRSPAQFEHDLASTLREGCSGGGRKGGETCPKSRSALAAFAVNNSAGEAGGVVQAAGNNPAQLPKALHTTHQNN